MRRRVRIWGLVAAAGLVVLAIYPIWAYSAVGSVRLWPLILGWALLIGGALGVLRSILGR